MIIEVRPITKDSKAWAPSDDRSFKRPQSIFAFVSNGKYVVDLPETRLKELEKETGLNLSLIYNATTPHTFFDDTIGRVKLENNTMFFDTTDPLKEIQVAILKGHPIVANSVTDLEEDKWPNAEFVIYDSKAEISAVAVKADKEFEAGEIVRKLDPETKKSLILILTGENVSNQDDSYVMGVLHGIVKNQLDQFLKFANQDPSDLRDIALVVKALDFGILVEDEGKILYGDVDFGYGQNAAVDFLKKPKNSQLREAILDKVKQIS